MARHRARWWVALIRPPLVAIRFVLGPIFSVLLGPLDRRQTRRNRERLAQDVRVALPFLFAEFQGQVVPDEYQNQAQSFDYACVTVAVTGLMLRFWRGREELTVSAAPAFRPSDWHDLGLILSAIAGDERIVRQQFVSLQHVSRVLAPNMAAVVALFSLSRFDNLKSRLNQEVYDVDRVMIRAWENEINRRLYGE